MRCRGGAVARLALAAAAAERAGAMQTWGVLPDADNFAVYVGKFCFDYTPRQEEEAGYFNLTVRGKVLEGVHQVTESSEGPPCWGPCEAQGNLYLLVYDDQEERWGKAREKWDTLTCEEMLHDATFAYTITPLDGSLNRKVDIRETLRPRFWYFVFAACGVETVVPVEYELHAENIRQGFQSEFSLDEKGSVPLHLSAAFLFMAVAQTLRLVARRATGAEALRSRPLLRLLLVSTMCSAAGASSLSLHFAVYMLDGYGLGTLEVLGQVFVCCAKGALTLLVLLVAKGWALFYSPEDFVRRRLLLLLWAVAVVLSIACEIHVDYFRDWSTTLYLYETWPGLVILLLNVLFFCEAWRSMRNTYCHETSEEVRIFYVMIALASVFYFLTLPLVGILAVTLEPWVRAKYVARAEVMARFSTTLILSICLRPTRLDAMVNARLEEGLATVGEPRDDTSEEEESSGDSDGPRRPEAQRLLSPRHSPREEHRRKDGAQVCHAAEVCPAE